MKSVKDKVEDRDKLVAREKHIFTKSIFSWTKSNRVLLELHLLAVKQVSRLKITWKSKWETMQGGIQ